MTEQRLIGSWMTKRGNNTFTLSFFSEGKGMATATYYEQDSSAETESNDFTYVMLDYKSGVITSRRYAYFNEEETETLFFRMDNHRICLYKDCRFVETLLYLDKYNND